jgi:hypothetical protein
MRYLYVLDHVGYLRHFDLVIERLASEGHSIHIVIDRLMIGQEKDKITENMNSRMIELSQKYKTVTYDKSPRPERGFWYYPTLMLRKHRDYIRYFDPAYGTSSKLVYRAKLWNPLIFNMLEFAFPLRSKSFWKMYSDFLRKLEIAIPASKNILNFIKSDNPDVVVVSPLVAPAGSQQTEFVKAAQKLGKRVALCVASWDNLTNKGLIRLQPELITVWNDFQKDEAITMHDINEDQVFVTGAQTFDEWFVRKPSRSLEDFKKSAGLMSAGDFVLYCCSSSFIAPQEREFVTNWVQAIRNSKDENLNNINILIRPHPKNIKIWEDFASSDSKISVWPKTDAGTSDDEGRSNYFDSLFYCKAIVGLNTSAFVEASILNKAVMTILDSNYVGTQQGTVHFHLLSSDEKGGLLIQAKSFEEHVSQLELVIAGKMNVQDRTESFVKKFIRPYGRAVSGNNKMYEAMISVSTKKNYQYERTQLVERLTLPFVSAFLNFVCLFPVVAEDGALGSKFILHRKYKKWIRKKQKGDQ